MLNWLPNAVTFIRILAAPVVGAMIWLAAGRMDALEVAVLYGFAFLIFSFACLTDWIDGYLARALKAESEFGAKLDLWADKVLVAAALFGGLAVFWPAALIGLVTLTGRDAVIMWLRSRYPSVNLAATFLAKSKTAIVMTGLAGLMAGAAYWFALAAQGNPPNIPAISLLAVSGTLFALGSGLSLVTAWQYIAATRRQRPA
ncbi:MAG: CDP-alcohol phosphatidyltransferase family protein [Pseudomonadota bacterium]